MKRSQNRDLPTEDRNARSLLPRRFAVAALKTMLLEDGAAMVEMGLAAVVAFAFLFGIVETSYMLYSYNYVSNAARDASRYAAVRGPNSCNDANVTPFPNCNLKPTSFTSTTVAANNPLLKYIESAGYPGLTPSKTSLEVKYMVATKTSAGLTTWAYDSKCSSTSDLDTNGNACNNVGNMINVKVIYQFPLNIPFWRSVTVPVGSTSQMMISE